MRFRNTIVVLTRIAGTFPMLAEHGSSLVKKVQAAAHEETREDLKVLTQGLLASLRKHSKSWVLNMKGDKVPAPKPPSATVDAAMASNANTPRAPSTLPPTQARAQGGPSVIASGRPDNREPSKSGPPTGPRPTPQPNREGKSESSTPAPQPQRDVSIRGSAAAATAVAAMSSSTTSAAQNKPSSQRPGRDTEDAARKAALASRGGRSAAPADQASSGPKDHTSSHTSRSGGRDRERRLSPRPNLVEQKRDAPLPREQNRSGPSVRERGREPEAASKSASKDADGWEPARDRDRGRGRGDDRPRPRENDTHRERRDDRREAPPALDRNRLMSNDDSKSDIPTGPAADRRVNPRGDGPSTPKDDRGPPDTPSRKRSRPDDMVATPQNGRENGTPRDGPSSDSKRPRLAEQSTRADADRSREKDSDRSRDRVSEKRDEPPRSFAPERGPLRDERAPTRPRDPAPPGPIRNDKILDDRRGGRDAPQEPSGRDSGWDSNRDRARAPDNAALAARDVGPEREVQSGWNTKREDLNRERGARTERIEPRDRDNHRTSERAREPDRPRERHDLPRDPPRGAARSAGGWGRSPATPAQPAPRIREPDVRDNHGPRRGAVDPIQDRRGAPVSERRAPPADDRREADRQPRTSRDPTPSAGSSDRGHDRRRKEHDRSNRRRGGKGLE